MNSHGDRGAALAAQAGTTRSERRRLDLALATLAFGLIIACGASREPTPAAPSDAPARDIVLRTSRFSIHANAYVDFYAAARASSLLSDGADSGALPLLDGQLVDALGACSDDPCAENALVGTGFDALRGFLPDTWSVHESDSRRTLGRSGTSLMNLEDVLAPVLARQIGVVWPDESVTVYVAHTNGRFDGEGGRDGSVLDIEGECFHDDALLECLFTRALEVLLPVSELGRAIENERERRGVAKETATPGAAACVATLAAAAAVAAGERSYTPTRRFVTVCSERERAWLAEEWPKRMRGDESPQVFAERLVAEAMHGGW